MCSWLWLLLFSVLSHLKRKRSVSPECIVLSVMLRILLGSWSSQPVDAVWWKQGLWSYSLQVIFIELHSAWDKRLINSGLLIITISYGDCYYWYFMIFTVADKHCITANKPRKLLIGDNWDGLNCELWIVTFILFHLTVK